MNGTRSRFHADARRRERNASPDPERTLAAVLGAFAAMTLLVTCGNGGARSGEAPESAKAPSASDRPPVVASALELRVVYVEGEARAFGPAGERPLDLGDAIAPGETLRTGALSALEFELGDVATLRLSADSSVSVDLAVAEALGSDVRVRASLGLSAGSLLSKVRALAGGDSFRVTTDHAYCGVRGTEFLVSVSDGDATRVVVKEGRVAALHAGPVIDRLAAASGSDGLARAALGVLVVLAPSAGAGETLVIGAADAAKADAALGALELELSSVARNPPPSNGLPWDPFAVNPAESERPAVPSEDELATGRRLVAPSLPLPVKASREDLEVFGAKAPPAPEPKPGARAPALPHPAIAAGWTVSARPARGALVQVPGLDGFVLLSVDSGGSLAASDATGAVLWRKYVEGAQGGHPVTYKGRVYVSGSRELVVLDGATGLELARRPVEPGAGDRAAPFPDGVLLASATGFDLIDPDTAATLREVRVEGGVSMSPAHFQGLAAVVDKGGRFMLYDVASGEKRLEIATSARNPLPSAPRIFESLACFGDSSGLVVLVDLGEGRVRWERRMSEGPASELELNASGTVAFAGDTIRAWDADGLELMEPIRGVSAPPLLSRDALYFGTVSGELVVWRIGPPPPAKTGSAALGDIASARPLLAGGFLYIGTRGGKLVKLDPAKLSP
ncbi:MAG: PQQ-binding-like beta-propeller repeat protein [Spirochaetales bacterium]|nr:PQQ-binding-like beta-propeller repeat protein [Spirochaetales bacterium]